MFRKVNNKEEIVGFYSTGPLLKKNDLKIRALMRKFCTHEPIFIIIDVRPGVQGLPTTAYEAKEEIEGTGGGKETLKLPSERIGLLMVFRPFERVSYALVLEVNDTPRVGDLLVLHRVRAVLGHVDHARVHAEQVRERVLERRLRERVGARAHPAAAY